MENIIILLNIISEILSFGSVLLIIILYFLSIKKCFYRGNISKFKLFILTLISNPVILYIIVVLSVAIVGKVLDIKEKMHIDFATFTFSCMFLCSILYLVTINILSNRLGKRLGAYNNELVSFVTMMYSIIFSLMMKNDISDSKNAADYCIIVDIVVYIAYYSSAFILYNFVISVLSKLTDKQREINSKVFVVPLAIFTIFYNTFAFVSLYYFDIAENSLVTLFSTIILFLFIWAFYVIIHNINSTNEANEAKDMAAAAARMEARIEADLSIAKDIQVSALPNVFPPFPNHTEFELFASMHPAKEVGGDFYDFYMLNETTLGFLIADVSGKSIPGAMFMMTSKTLIKSLAESGLSPAEVFTIANEKLCEGNEAEMFVTAWLGYLDLKTGLVHVANAGHNPPVLIRYGKPEYLIFNPGLMLAGMDGVRYKEQTVQLERGDILYLYTDGVTEAMNQNEEQYGEEKLKNKLYFGNHYPDNFSETEITKSVCYAVSEDIEKFTNGAEQSDDITMLCIRYLGGK